MPGLLAALRTSAAAMLGLGGCQSLTVAAIKTFDQKPYSYPVAARELQEASPVAEAQAPVIASASPAADPPVQAEAPAPARTNIRGQGDGAMTDDRVVIIARAKDIPHRVPDFSREQVAAMVCAVRASGGNEGRVKTALRAYDATIAAYDTGAAFEAGQRSLKETDAAERKREDAVKAMIGGGMLFDMLGGRSTKADLPKPEQEGVTLENVDLFTFVENGKAVMAVSGLVRNTTSERAELSPITLQAIDRWQFILAGQTSLLPFEALEAGEARPFEVRFHNPPDTTYEVYAHFAPPFEYRTRRECDVADPASKTPMLAPHSADAAAMLTSPVHTAAELNLLTRVYRTEAAATWGQRACAKPKEAKDPKSGKGGMKVATEGSGERRGGFSISIGLSSDKMNADGLCAAWSRRLPWRDMFALAEATDEAWGAMLASTEMQRRQAAGLATQAEVDAADAGWRRGYAAFRDLGARALQRAGGGVPDVEVDIAKSSYGYEQISKAFSGADISEVGFYVDVAGRIRNTGSASKQIDALMLALVDRLEQPLVTFKLDNQAQLAPGESREFAHRVFLSEPIRRENSKETPPWQLRVGAVAH